MASIDSGGKAPRRSWRLGGSLILAVLLVACGNDSPADGPTTTVASEAGGGDASPATTTKPEPTSSVGDDGNAEDPGQEAGTGGGSAAITIAGETVGFDSFTCYFDDDAVEAFGDDDLTFAALGQFETAEGTTTVAVSSIDSPFGPNYTIFFSPSGDAGMAWQRVGVDAAVIEGDRITGEGDFSKIVDNALTEETEVGSFEATCG